MESNKDYWPTPSVSMYPPAGNTLFKREDVERAIDKSLPPGTIRLNGRIYPAIGFKSPKVEQEGIRGRSITHAICDEADIALSSVTRSGVIPPWYRRRYPLLRGAISTVLDSEERPYMPAMVQRHSVSIHPTALYSHQREAIEKALGDKALRIQRGLGKARTSDLFRAWYEVQQAKAAIREASANRLQIGRDGMFDGRL